MYKKRFKDLIKNNKTLIITLSSVLLLMLTIFIVIPTAARFKNRASIVTTSVWDGTVATKYKKGDGSITDPYIISNGSELAFFAEELNNTNYEDEYFKISNNIVLNHGIFGYDEEDGLIYILNDNKYYIKNNTNEYYDDLLKEDVVGLLNNFNTLNNFKGNLDGSYFRIYGLFIASEEDEVGLFTNLEGNIENLYVENTIINGGYITGGIASSSSSSNLKNILFDGIVLGNESDEIIESIDLEDYTTSLNNLFITDEILIDNDLLLKDGDIVKTTLYGTMDLINTSQSVDLKINNESVLTKNFELNFNQNLYESLNLEIEPSLLEGELKLSNLRYEIIYKNTHTGGIVGYANNVVLENVINKGRIIGDYNSSGLISLVRGSFDIKRSYNKGFIHSNHNTAGLINTIDESLESNIYKSYNDGVLNSSLKSSLIGNVYNSDEINLYHVISNSEDHLINNIIDTDVVVSNSYTTKEEDHVNNGLLIGEFNYALLEDILTDEDIKDDLLYDEFINFNDIETNDENVWVYDEGILPILFIDDLKDSLVSINSSIYTWTNYSMELDYYNFSSNITFNIEDLDALNPSKKIYYYISDTEEALFLEDIKSIDTWTEYNDIVKIEEEGTYVIYVKTIDYNDNEYYSNTDFLVLDQSNEGTNLKLNNYVWGDYNNSPKTIYIHKNETIDLELGSDIVSAYYHVTESKKTIKALASMSVSSWDEYVDGINIEEEGKHIVYVKITDIDGKNLYLNTDYILYEGYNLNNVYNISNISNKSEIKLEFTYFSDYLYHEVEKHVLVTNYLLPVGTYIKLEDNINNKKYYYKVSTSDDLYGYNNSCDILDLECEKEAVYSFEDFKEVGSTKDYYEEDNYYKNNEVNEDFTITLHFNNATINDDIEDFRARLRVYDTNDDIMRYTLNKDVKLYNIITSNDYREEITITTDFEEEIIYNSNSITNIELDTKIDYKLLNLMEVYDTRLFNKKLGMEVSFVKNNNIVDVKYLKNMQIKVDGKTYYPDKNGMFRIRLNNNVVNSINDLEIITLADNNNLSEGLYNLKLTLFASNDGLFGDKYIKEDILIPVRVLNNEIANTYIYSVSGDKNLITKELLQDTINYKISLNTSVVNPNIRVSLYEKKELSAYNQEYTLININNYVSNNLELIANNVYYAFKNPVLYESPFHLFNQLDLEFNTSNLDYNSYKLRFEFYNDNTKINTIEKVFIVR